MQKDLFGNEVPEVIKAPKKEGLTETPLYSDDGDFDEDPEDDNYDEDEEQDEEDVPEE